ncbi:GQ67_00714T0 [Komagataella phaffii]|nr:GQ67_00714T0 [Komagataella phaffii]AOA68025.1 GQ68_00675T0 [Komagataella phaffii GS115]
MIRAKPTLILTNEHVFSNWYSHNTSCVYVMYYYRCTLKACLEEVAFKLNLLDGRPTKSPCPIHSARTSYPGQNLYQFAPTSVTSKHLSPIYPQLKAAYSPLPT